MTDTWDNISSIAKEIGKMNKSFKKLSRTLKTMGF